MKVRPEWIDVNVLYRNLHIGMPILATATFGLSDVNPVCRSVTGATEPCRIDKGFDKGYGMPITTIPVLIKLFQA